MTTLEWCLIAALCAIGWLLMLCLRYYNLVSSLRAEIHIMEKKEAARIESVKNLSSAAPVLTRKPLILHYKKKALIASGICGFKWRYFKIDSKVFSSPDVKVVWTGSAWESLEGAIMIAKKEYEKAIKPD